MNPHKSFLATIRFGLGGRPVSTDSPTEWLLQQLTDASPRPIALRNLDSSESLIREYIRMPPPRTEDAREQRRQAVRTIYEQEITARLHLHRTTKHPFRERLVQFWSNHFTVSITKPELRALVGAFEREAIRPHITGSFYELLLAATQHPAMLIYLDNARSIGPNSEAARRNNRGINENHARELLELHTLGVNGGYTQADVEALARLLTGWSVTESGYGFDAKRHEPGEVEFLNYAYPDLGEIQGKAALNDLCRHPATATFIATKLCRHFVSDNPDPQTIHRIATTFAESDGNLLAVYRALLAEPASWEAFHKYKTPYEFLVSALRSLPTIEGNASSITRALGQSPFTAPSPAGWSDYQADWLTPESMGARIDWAETIGLRYQRGLNVNKLADALFGPLLSTTTRSALSASSFPLALLLASPEFQRR